MNQYHANRRYRSRVGHRQAELLAIIHLNPGQVAHIIICRDHDECLLSPGRQKPFTLHQKRTKSKTTAWVKPPSRSC